MMRITLPLSLALGFLLSSCGDPIDEGADRTIAIMDEIADILEEVDDEDSAEEAAVEIKELLDEVEELNKEMRKLMEDLDEDEKEELMEWRRKEWNEDFKKAQQRVQKEVAGLKTTDYGQKELGDLLRELD